MTIFFLRGKGKGELRIDAKFTSSKALMSAYLQEVPNTPVSINHSLLHITLTLNLIWWAIFLTISKSLGDLATAQYRVPAYFPSHSDCQVFAMIAWFSITDNLIIMFWFFFLRQDCTPVQQAQLMFTFVPQTNKQRCCDFSKARLYSCAANSPTPVVLSSGEVYQPAGYFLWESIVYIHDSCKHYWHQLQLHVV